MIRHDAGTTNATLLNRLCDWRDHEAWADFVARYDPVIRFHCRRYGFDAETTDELCQQVWIELARRMLSFRYDPGGTFRGWLRLLCHSRAIDLKRKRKAEPLVSLDHQAEASWQVMADDHDESAESERPLLLQLAAEVQDAVRRRIGDRTWRVFWSIAVEGKSVREMADLTGMTYFATFAAQKRVSRMLREEGQRLLSDWGARDAEVGPSGT